MELTEEQRIRRDNFATLVDELGGREIAIEQLQTSKSLVSQYIKGSKGMGEKKARKIEALGKKQKGWLDIPSAWAESRGFYNTTPVPSKRINERPIISWVQAGDWGDAIDPYEPGVAEDWRPAHCSCSGSSYWLRVVGDSMFDPSGKRPSYSDGDLILVDPEQSGDAGNGSPIIAKLADDSIELADRVTFKKLVKDGPRIYLAPINTTIYQPIFDKFEVIGLVLGGFY